MDDLSPRQQEILEVIRSSVQLHGVCPTYRELGVRLGIGSTNAISDHIKALMKKGYLERVGGPGTPRALRLTEAGSWGMESSSSVSVPIVGRVAAGQPLLAVENREGALQIDAGMLPRAGRVFALVVKGDSMIEDGIHEGDYLLVRQQETARDGEIAVIMVDGEATVKRIYREGKRVRLQPANREMEPIFVDGRGTDVSIVGVAVGLYRRI